MADVTTDPTIAEFERDCKAASVSPHDVLAAAGLHRATWFRWKAGAASPTLKTFREVRVQLEKMRGQDVAA